MREHDTDDIRVHGGIPLDIIQRYLNFHFSVSLDLFGGETSSNVAAYFTAGLKGRWSEPRRKDDHRLVDLSISVDSVVDGRPGHRRSGPHRPQPGPPPRVRPRLRERVAPLEPDPRGGRDRAGSSWLPHQAFNRHVGAFAAIHTSPEGEVLDDAAWERRRDEWLPSRADLDFVASLMTRSTSRGGSPVLTVPSTARNSSNINRGVSRVQRGLISR